MDDQRHAGALTDEALEREIARALAVDPSPEFVARVRTQIANEPRPTVWRMSWMLSAFALVAVAVLLAVMIDRRDGVPALVTSPLASRAIDGHPAMLPYVGSGFLTAEASAKAVSRTSGQYGVSAFRRTTASPAKAGRPILSLPLLDPRETQALRALIAGVRTNRVDLSPLLQSGAPAPMELPPVDDLVIAPLAIEPIAPTAGAQGERQ